MTQDQQETSLSISQRAYLITKLLGNFGKSLRSILVLNSFFLALGWIVLYSHVNILDFILLELSLGTAVTTVSYLVTGRRVYRQVNEWNEDYLEQAYILVFNTTIPQGNTTGEKVLNLARTIFPELRSDYFDFLPPIDTDYIKYYFRKKFGKSKVQNTAKSLNYKVNSHSFDVVLKTANGYFIVKDFKEKVVALEDLKQLAEIIRGNFKDKYQRTNVFRVICVAKQYDQPFLQQESLEHTMIESLGAKIKFDLLVEEKVGYSVLWVG